MEKKKAITQKQTSDLLAAFIVKNWHFCPVDENYNVPECECWGSEMCQQCIKKHADQLNGGNGV